MFSTEIHYAVVRYMLNELGDEAANVGIVAVVNDSRDYVARFMPDPAVKSRSDAKVHKEVIARYSALLETEFSQFSKMDSQDFSSDALARLRSVGSNVVRLSAPRSVLTNDVNRELDVLYGQLVASSATREIRELKPRDPLGGLRREASGAIRKNLRNALSSEFRKGSFKSSHEVKGQKHTSVFDAAVVTKARKQIREHLFHHVLLLPDAEESFNQAASLLWKWQDVREKSGTNRDLTAVLFSRSGTRREGLEEAKTILRKDDVQIAEVGQLARLAKRLEPQLELMNG